MIVMVIMDMKTITNIMLSGSIIDILLYITIFHIITMGSNSYNINLPNCSSAASLRSLKLMSWNATGMSSGSYLGRTLEILSVDICGISEHWLYRNDLHFLDSVHSSYRYAVVSDFDLEKPSRRKVGKGGVAIFWNQSLDSRVSLLSIDDDRILGIKYQISIDNFVYIIQVYLLSANHTFSQLGEYLLKLQNICMYIEMGTLIIMGDFNAHVNGKQFVKPHDRRSALFSRFLASNNLVSLNTLPLYTGAWSSFVSNSGEHTSMIDHILVPAEKVDLVTERRILDDDALNVSNHRPVCCLILFPLKSLNKEIDHAAEVSSEYFWKMVNKRKNNNSSNVGCEINFHNRTYRDPGEICNQWGQYLHPFTRLLMRTVTTVLIIGVPNYMWIRSRSAI